MLLMRHGEGEQNVADIWDRNAPLTKEGAEEVRKLALELMAQGYNNDSIAHVYISPVPRVIQTAQVLVEVGFIAPEKVIIEPRITRRDMGKYEGQPVIHWGEGKKDDLPNVEELGVETTDKIRRRVSNFYQELMRSSLDGHVMIITHGSISREIMDMHVGDRQRLELSEVRIMDLHYTIR